jgi:Domain of unknown function (DUF4405)
MSYPFDCSGCRLLQECSMLKQFRFRSFISISAFLFFIMMVISGAAAYIKPEGSVASWQSWSFLCLGKGEWEALHTLTGIFFLILSVIHIILNWNMLFQYLRQRSFMSIEMILGGMFVLLIVVSSVKNIPPVYYLMDAGEYISGSWGGNGTPPVNRAERCTLLDLCSQPEVNIALPEAVKRLKDAGISSVDPSLTLEVLAGDNGKSPAELWMIISEGVTTGP